MTRRTDTFHPTETAFQRVWQKHNLSLRRRVETAAQEGAPLVEDIGQPIGPDDLDANRPLATAYEDLPSAGGYAGNIRLDGLSTPHDIRRALINTDAKVGGFDAATRGKVSLGETEALAREMGMTADDLLKRRKGQALQQFRMTAESKAAHGRTHRALIEQAGGGDRLDEAAQAILAALGAPDP